MFILRGKGDRLRGSHFWRVWVLKAQTVQRYRGPLAEPDRGVDGGEILEAIGYFSFRVWRVGPRFRATA